MNWRLLSDICLVVAWLVLLYVNHRQRRTIEALKARMRFMRPYTIPEMQRMLNEQTRAFSEQMKVNVERRYE